MEWHEVAQIVGRVLLYGIALPSAYLTVGVAMAGGPSDDLDWLDRIAVILWPIAATFGILCVVGRLIREAIAWGLED